MMLDPLIGEVIAISLGGLFVLSGSMKFLEFSTFRGTLNNYKLLSPFLLNPVGISIMLIELAMGALVLVNPGSTRSIGLVGIALLLLVYGAAIGINILRGRRHIDCGCLGFGARKSNLGWLLVGRNLCLSLLAFYGVMSSVVWRPATAIEWISVAMAPIAYALIYLAFNQMQAMGPDVMET